jgi:pyruvate kinase
MMDVRGRTIRTSRVAE